MPARPMFAFLPPAKPCVHRPAVMCATKSRPNAQDDDLIARWGGVRQGVCWWWCVLSLGSKERKPPGMRRIWSVIWRARGGEGGEIRFRDVPNPHSSNRRVPQSSNLTLLTGPCNVGTELTSPRSSSRRSRSVLCVNWWSSSPNSSCHTGSPQRGLLGWDVVYPPPRQSRGSNNRREKHGISSQEWRLAAFGRRRPMQQLPWLLSPTEHGWAANGAKVDSPGDLPSRVRLRTRSRPDSECVKVVWVFPQPARFRMRQGSVGFPAT
jgi:hypothetical protein